MKRLAPLTLALAMALGASQAFASSHLLPEGDSLGDYHALVREVLKETFAPSVRIRAIVEPSFQPEFAAGLKEEAGDFKIFFLQPSRQVWNYTTLQMMKNGQMTVQNPDGSPGTAEEIKRLEAKLPADPKTLKVDRCEVAIEPTLAHRLIADWTGMLDRVAPPETSDIGLDGETYHFSLGGSGKAPEGKAWSPDPASEPGMLVGIVYAMRDYCRARRPEDLAKLDRLSSDLQAKLRAEPR